MFVAMAIGGGRLLAGIGYHTRSFLEAYGALTVLGARSTRVLPTYYRQFARQYRRIGLNPLPLSFATSVFLGLVLGVQIGNQIDPETPPRVEALLILRSVLIEMGPGVAGLVIAGYPRGGEQHHRGGGLVLGRSHRP